MGEDATVPAVTLGVRSPVSLTKASAGSQGGIFAEIGRTGLRHWGGYVLEEWLRELQGGRRAAEAFREMIDSDAVTGGIVYAIEMLCRRVSWWVDPASDARPDQEAAELYEQCLLEDMSSSWSETLTEVLSFLWYGWSYLEIVYKRRGGDVRDPSRRSKYSDGRIGIRKLAIRSQDSLDYWDFDDGGGIQAMRQSPPPDFAPRIIPIDKALLFRTKSAKGNPEGRSILRSAYRSWYFLKNIQNVEGIGIERDLAGLPVLKVPKGFDIWNPNDTVAAAVRREAERLVSSIRRDEEEGVLLPEGWELELLTTGGRRQFDTSAIVTRYEQRIAMTVLADVILLGHDQTGSYALAKTKSLMFSSALEGFLDHVADVCNDHLAARLFRLNPIPGMTGMPTLRHGQVDVVDLAELGEFLKTLAGSGAPLWPNEELLEKVLDLAGLPAPDPEEQELAAAAAREPVPGEEPLEDVDEVDEPEDQPPEGE